MIAAAGRGSVSAFVWLGRARGAVQVPAKPAPAAAAAGCALKPSMPTVQCVLLCCAVAAPPPAQTVASAALQEAYDDLAVRFNQLELENAKQHMQLVGPETCL